MGDNRPAALTRGRLRKDVELPVLQGLFIACYASTKIREDEGRHVGTGQGHVPPGFDNSWRAPNYFRVMRKLFFGRLGAAGGGLPRIRRTLAAGDGHRVV